MISGPRKFLVLGFILVLVASFTSSLRLSQDPTADPSKTLESSAKPAPSGFPTDLISEFTIPPSATSSVVQITNFTFTLPANWGVRIYELRNGSQTATFSREDQSFRIQCSAPGQDIGGKGMELASLRKEQGRTIHNNDDQYILSLNTMTASSDQRWLQFIVLAEQGRPRCNGQSPASGETAAAMQAVYESWQ